MRCREDKDFLITTHILKVEGFSHDNSSDTYPILGQKLMDIHGVKQIRSIWALAVALLSTLQKKLPVQAGLSVSRSTSYDLATHIPADASRFSKLGFASDMNSLSYRYKVYNAAGVCTMSTIDTVTCPTIDSYLIVYYQ